MKAKYVGIVATLAVAVLGLTACGGSATYKDGTYEGKSEVYDYAEEDGTDEGNGYGVATITIEGGKITDCKFVTYEPDGTLKDEEYGKKQGSVANRDFYNKAQKAVAACSEYADLLVQNGQLDGIDAISGATKNYDQFTEAVERALEQAEE